MQICDGIQQGEINTMEPASNFHRTSTPLNWQKFITIYTPIKNSTITQAALKVKKKKKKMNHNIQKQNSHKVWEK